MPDIHFQTAWQRNDATLLNDAKAFWRREDAFALEEIETRAAELCAVAYQNDKMVAVSTASFFHVPRLRARFFYYRTTVSRDCRRQQLATRLCFYSRDLLAQWALEHPEEKVKGLFIIPQAEEFRSRLAPPIIRRRDLEIVLVGYTPNGYQMRVVWFADATVE